MSNLLRRRRYVPEPLLKRVIAWMLLFSFFLQCAPVAAWALPLPEEQAETSIWDSARNDEAEPAPNSTRKVFPVTPENLRARAARKVAEESPAENATSSARPELEEEQAPSSSHRSDSHEERHRSPEAEDQSHGREDETPGHSGNSGGHQGDSKQVTGHHDQDHRSHGHDSGDSEEHSSSKSPMAVILPAGKLPGEPEAPLSRLANEAGSYTPVGTNNPVYSYDHALVCKKTYPLRNPGEERIFWDFYGPAGSESRAKTSRHTTASVEFIYSSTGRCATHKDATYSLETRVYDNNSPGGRRVSREESAVQLEQLVAYAGVATPAEGLWRWKETRGHGQRAETTFEVKKAPPASGAWVRRINGKYQPILAPFVAHATDDWLMHNKSYMLPAAAGSTFRAEWNWFAPEASLNRNRNHAYLTVRMDYRREFNGYRVITRVFDQVYPKRGRLLEKKSGTGVLAQTVLTYGTGHRCRAPGGCKRKSTASKPSC